MQRNGIPAALALLAVIACVGGAADGAAAAARRPPNDRPAPTSPTARRGLLFAEQHCAGCHAVAANRASPNPESPSFEDIANRPGVSRASLQQFLRDSHNYPEAMNFRVGAAQVSDLADYIGTLRKRGYRPVM
jgi:mono/diheme cytochrome c family protein